MKILQMLMFFQESVRMVLLGSHVLRFPLLRLIINLLTQEARIRIFMFPDYSAGRFLPTGMIASGASVAGMDKVFCTASSSKLPITTVPRLRETA